MNYNRGDIVILPFPFVTRQGAQQKARPALIVSDHSIARRFSDAILVGITSRVPDKLVETEYVIATETPEFRQSGLAKSSVVRCEYAMTIPHDVIAYKLGALPTATMTRIDQKLKTSLGLA